MNDLHKREAVSAEQMTYPNMPTINALVELLAAKIRIAISARSNDLAMVTHRFCWASL